MLRSAGRETWLLLLTIIILLVQGVLQVGKMESEGAYDEPFFLSFLS